jgi:hypothetical protein
MMDDLRTRARLVDFDHAGAVVTVVTRAEIAETAAGTEFPATLVLDLEKADEPTAQATVAVDWDQDALEQLLASTDDDEIGLWFDENELAMAFDEVEGHGIRQRAAVLTLAVAAAGATSAPAFARMAAEPGAGGGAAANPATAITQAGVERGLLQDQAVSQGLSRPDPAGDKTAVLAGTERALQQDQAVSQGMGSIDAAVASTRDGSTLSTAEVAGAAAGGLLLISAAGFGIARKRTTPPVQPA